MGAPVQGIKAAEDSTAETLLDSLKSITAAERRKHATVFNYWLSIRGDRQFPPIRDLDPLEISDAGPSSVLLEMIGGGDDADIRHLGQAIKNGVEVDRVSLAPRPSLLSCIASKLPIVASSRQAFAFEDEFVTAEGQTRCWVTLLPFSSSGTWIDYVYGFVSLDSPANAVEEAVESAPEPVEALAEPEVEEAVEEVVAEPEPGAVVDAPEPEAIAEIEEPIAEAPFEEPAAEYVDECEPKPAKGKPGFSAKLFESLASVGGFYGRVVEVDQPSQQGSEEEQATEGYAEEPAAAEFVEEPAPEQAPVEIQEPVAEEVIEETAVEETIEDPMPEEPVAEEVIEEPVAEIQDEPIEDSVEKQLVVDEPEKPAANKEANETKRVTEGVLQSKLAEVRSKADEARAAKLRANAALYDGLSAAYDFALEAEDNAEEYLKLVEEQGLKIQLRSPMKPVVKLAFDGMCDEATIAQLEAVLAWALKMDLPKGGLAERIESEGGIGPILASLPKAA